MTADSTARFIEAVRRPEPDVALDEVAFLLAAHAYPSLDVDRQCARLDRLATGCPEPTLAGLTELLFGDRGFAGNREQYYDPRNSYLNDVLDRRIGIPITLSILAMEVGRRLGVGLDGISMPGHFLVREAGSDTFVDPFAGGIRLDRDGVRAHFHRIHGGDAPWDDVFLAPVGPHAIVARLLANLKAIFRARRDRTELIWVLRLRGAVPGVGLDERRELASVLAADGRFGDAAAELEHAADQSEDETAEEFRAAAVRLRARMN